jgi:protein O-GlcNAc transferase
MTGAGLRFTLTLMEKTTAAPTGSASPRMLIDSSTIRHLSDFDAARRIHDDGVDILVDLMGYMKHNRLGIFAFRPAPVQVEYLGYPGTTGADFMDYLIADHVVTPKGENTYYSENLVRMPHCYQINDNTQKISAKSFNRAECGLPQNAFVYLFIQYGL